MRSHFREILHQVTQNTRIDDSDRVVAPESLSTRQLQNEYAQAVCRNNVSFCSPRIPPPMLATGQERIGAHIWT